jgi:CHAT domain-containing protein
LQNIFFIFFSVFLSLPAFPENKPEQSDTKWDKDNAFEKGLIFYNCGSYDSAVFWLTAYLKDDCIPGTMRQYTEALIKLGYSHCLLNDFVKADQTIIKAERLIKSHVLNEDIKNDIILARGYYHFLNSEFNKAIQCYVIVYESDSGKYKKCLYFIGSSYLSLGKTEMALAYFNSLFFLSKDVFTRYLNNISPDLLRICEQAKRQEDNKVLWQVEQLVDKILTYNLLSDDPEQMYSRYYLGIVFENIEKYQMSIDFLKSAEIHFSKMTDFQSIEINICIHYTLGKLNSKLNDPEKAEKYFQQANMQINENKEVGNRVKYDFWMLYSHNAIRTKRYGIAKARLDSAGQYLDVLSADDVANYYNSMGIALKNLQKYDEAKESYLKAINARKSVAEIHYQNLSRDYLNYSELLLLMGRQSEAIAMGKESCRIITSLMGKKSGSSSIAYTSLANIYRDCRMYNEAMQMYNRALLATTTQNVFGNRLYPNAGSVTYTIGYIKALAGKAGLLQDLAGKNTVNRTNYLIMSLSCYMQSLSALEKVRSGFQFEEGKLQMAGNERYSYNQAAMVAAELYRLTKRGFYLDIFFNITERAKSVVLLEKISMDEETKNKYKQLIKADVRIRKEIAGYENQLSKIKTADLKRQDAVKKHLFRLYEIQEWFFEELKSKFPEYYSTWVKPEFAGIKEVQDNLKGNECLISYFNTDSLLFTMIIKKNHLFLYRQKNSPDFASLVSGMYSELKTGNSSSMGKSHFVNFVNKSDSLYHILLKPVEPHIQNNDLIIASDGLLHYLPFEVLIKNRPEKMDMQYHTLNFLIREHAVSHTGSASLYCRLCAEPSHKAESISVFAPTYSSCGGDVCDVVKKYGIKDLESSSVESAVLKDELNASLYEGNDANEAKFKELVAVPGIINLTMHGIINEDNPDQSMLVFGNGGKHEDGLLHTWEIYNLNVNAEMIVLGACHTGSGRLRTGEGAISIARAFLYAGCHSVVMAGWAVNDISSNQILTSFYLNLKNGDNKAAALQKAKKEYIQNMPSCNAHPGYWAGLVVMGNNEPLADSDYSIIIYLMLIAALVVAIGLVYKKSS